MHYIYPPRPRSKILPQQLAHKEAEGMWLWQYKFDGSRCVVGLSDHHVSIGNRHGKWHSPEKFLALRTELLSLDLPGGIHYLDGEMLAGEILVVFDILRLSQYLIGVSQLQRLELLAGVCRHPTRRCDGAMALQVSDHIWMAEHGFSDFVGEFHRFSSHRLVEGLVLRRKNSKLDNWGAQPYEVDWQIRCRHGKKNFRY